MKTKIKILEFREENGISPFFILDPDETTLWFRVEFQELEIEFLKSVLSPSRCNFYIQPC